jgi:hypothetical protein
MRRARTLRFGTVFTIALVVASCGDGPVTPATPPGPSESLLGSLLGSNVKVAKRTTRLAQDEVASEVIGSSGGTIRLEKAGLKVEIPQGALSSSTRITVTAPAGDLVGYHFEPSGLQFKKSLTMTQSTKNTEIGLLRSPFAAYFKGDLLPEVRALEILDLNVLALLGIVTWKVDHFSGYVIATD